MSARVLLVTSSGAPAGAVTPVLAALEASDLEVRAIDVGRAGARYSDGVIDSVLRTLAGEFAERRLMKEIESNPPDVTVTFDPATTAALSIVRDDATRPAPVVAVVADLEPDHTWAPTDADRYFTIDDQAAVDLADHGVDGDRILSMGPIGERAFADAAAEDRDSLRARFKLGKDAPVVVVEVAGLGYELTSQIALQLSLLAGDTTFLFDAGNDAEAATALRRQVPTLDLEAKLFGRTPEVPKFWRCADIVVARPSDRAVAHAMMIGARMVAFMPQDSYGEALASGLESRRLGTVAGNALLLSSALEPLLGKKPRNKRSRSTVDGAGNIADAVWIVANERREVLEERRVAARASTRSRVEAAAAAAESASQATSAAGGLEDLSGGDFFADLDAAIPDDDDLTALRAEVSQRLRQTTKTVNEAREAAAQWKKKAGDLLVKGDKERAREAEKAADAESARMHAALSEMAQLQAEMARLEKSSARAQAAAGSSSRRSSTSSRSADGSRRRSSARPSSGGSGRAGSGTSSSASSGSGDSSSRYSGKSLDDMIDDMRSNNAQQQATIDDELAALKRKMRNKKK